MKLKTPNPYQFLDFKPVYLGVKKPGITRNADNRGKSGLYYIKENGAVVYIGKSSFCVLKTLYRHFQRWSDGDKVYTKPRRLTYHHLLGVNTYEVAIQLVDKESLDIRERLAILYARPRDNRAYYSINLDSSALGEEDLSDLKHHKIYVNNGDNPF